MDEIRIELGPECCPVDLESKRIGKAVADIVWFQSGGKVKNVEICNPGGFFVVPGQQLANGEFKIRYNGSGPDYKYWDYATTCEDGEKCGDCTLSPNSPPQMNNNPG